MAADMYTLLKQRMAQQGNVQIVRHEDVQKIFDKREENRKERDRIQHNERFHGELHDYLVQKAREYRESHREEINRKQREYRLKNIEREKKWKKEYYEKKKDSINERKRAEYAENPEKMKAINQKWREDNPEKVKESSKRSYEKMKQDPEKYAAFLAQKRAYNKRNYERKKQLKMEVA